MPAAVNGMKECSKCGETKDVSEYSKRRDGADGFRNQCKDCIKIVHSDYYQANREHFLNKRDQYCESNKEDINAQKRQRWHLDEEYRHKCSEYKKKWYNDNIEKVRQRRSRYYESNKEEIRELSRRYYQANRESLCERRKQKYQDNVEYRETVAQRRRQYRQSQKGSERIKQYQQDNKEAIRERDRLYRQKNRTRALARERLRAQRASAGVYEIENRITGKVYIGQSKDWKNRWNQHRWELSLGRHNNSSLQADYDEHGLDAFEHRVVEYPCDTSSDVLREHERQALISHIREGKEVYNSIC